MINAKMVSLFCSLTTETIFTYRNQIINNVNLSQLGTRFMHVRLSAHGEVIVFIDRRNN